MTTETARAPARLSSGGRLGVWLFLLTELMLFGGLFILYAAYRLEYTGGFREASRELDRALAAANTVVLLTSSLLVALAGAALETQRRRSRPRPFFGAALLGVVFLAVKALEWVAKFEHGLFPGSPVLERLEPGQVLFFGLYFVMTGLHALHVVVGIGLLVWAALSTGRRAGGGGAARTTRTTGAPTPARPRSHGPCLTAPWSKGPASTGTSSTSSGSSSFRCCT